MEKPFFDLMARCGLRAVVICRFPFIDVVVASAADGVPLMRGVPCRFGSFEVINPLSTIDIGSEEVEFPVCLAIVAEQVCIPSHSNG